MNFILFRPNIFIQFQNRRLFHDTQQGIILSNRTLVIQNTNLNHSGEYTCKADNKVGKSTSNTRFLNIKRKHRIFLLIIDFTKIKT